MGDPSLGWKCRRGGEEVGTDDDAGRGSRAPVAHHRDDMIALYIDKQVTRRL